MTKLYVHHNADMDGIASGALAKFYEEKIANSFDYELIGYNYELEHDCFTMLLSGQYQEVNFIDITPTVDVLKSNRLLELLDNGLKLFIYDHHKMRYDEIMELAVSSHKNFHFCFDNDKSAAKLFYESNVEYKDSTGSMSHIIDLVSSYDTWQWAKAYEETGNLEPLYLNEWSIRNLPKIEDAVESFYSLLSTCHDANGSLLFVELSTGKSIADLKFEQVSKNRYEIVNLTNGRPAIISSSYGDFYFREHLRRKLANEFSKDHDTFIITTTFKYADKQVKLSTRSLHESLNCAELCRSIDSRGGGHFGAAGCMTSIENFFSLIESRYEFKSTN